MIPPVPAGVEVSSRARFAWACVAGGVAAAAVFAWVVFGGRADALRAEPLSAFYDAQARSLLHGHWDTPAPPLSFERFTVDGKYFTYFGPWPAVLRMPVIAFTEEFDGRLSRVSMLLAFAVLLAFAARVAWQARAVVRGDAPLGWRSLLAGGGFVFVAGCGSTALFLGSRGFVYHEAILWAVAWSLAGFSFVVSYLLSGRGWSLVGASIAATLAMLSRPSVALGPVFALGLLLAARAVQRLWRWWHRPRASVQTDAARSIWLARWLGVSEEAASGSTWHVALATAVPLVGYAYVNYAKFGTLFSVPIDKQDILLRLPERRAALAATGNSLFGFDYIPTNLVQYLRPDAIGFRGTFPWVTFASAPHVFANAKFENIEPSASTTVTSIFLVALAVLGAIAALRGVRARRVDEDHTTVADAPSAAVFRVPLLAGAAAAVSTIAIADLFERYQGDFVPVLVVGAAVGLGWLAVLLQRSTRGIRRLVVGALVVAAAWSCWATFSLTVIYQREYSAFQDTAVRAGFVDFQLDVNDALGVGPPSVRRGDALPVIKSPVIRRTNAPHGQLFVVGDCRALYVASGRSWETVEEPAPGARRWRVRFESAPRGSRQPLWSAGTGPYQILWARWVDDEHVAFEYEWTGDPSSSTEGSATLHVEPGRTYDLDVLLDPPHIEVKHDDDVLFRSSEESNDSDRPATLGRQPDAAQGPTEFSGTIRPVSTTPICDRLTR
jgi:hypothetical protein